MTLPPLAFGPPASSAAGDAASEGYSGAAARADHKHAREAADANLSSTAGSVAQIDVGDAASAGASTQGARVDHQHALPVPAAASASAVGDAAAAGSATTVARADHVHGREAFATTSDIADVAATESAGSATTVARGDHVHASPLLHNPPRCRVYFNAGTQTLTTGTAAAVTFDAESSDATGMHSTVSNTSRVTIATAGWYRVTGTVAFAANATGFRGAYLRKNGTTVAETRMGSSQASVRHGQLVHDEILCAAGDFLELWAEQGSGGNLNLAAGEAVTFLHVVWCSST